MAIEIVRKIVNGEWATVAAESGGGGGSLTVTGATGSVDDVTTLNIADATVTEAAPGVAEAAGNVPVLTTETEFTDAQIKALPSTPTTLINAPGAGLMILPISGYVLVSTPNYDNYTGINVSSGGYYFELFDGGSSSDPLMFVDQGDVEDLLGGGFAATFYPLLLRQLAPGPGPSIITSYLYGLVDSPGINAPLRVRHVNGATPTTDLTGGNAVNSMKIRILYMVVEL